MPEGQVCLKPLLPVLKGPPLRNGMASDDLMLAGFHLQTAVLWALSRNQQFLQAPISQVYTRPQGGLFRLKDEKWPRLSGKLLRISWGFSKNRWREGKACVRWVLAVCKAPLFTCIIVLTPNSKPLGEGFGRAFYKRRPRVVRPWLQVTRNIE